jgi:Domain of unknown function (DUF6429)
MQRLYKAGRKSDPRSSAKTVVFTESGLKESERLLLELFGTRT